MNLTKLTIAIRFAQANARPLPGGPSGKRLAGSRVQFHVHVGARPS
jgi:hypothetical protein